MPKPKPLQLAHEHTKVDPFQLETNLSTRSIYERNALIYQQELKDMSRPYSSGRPKPAERLQVFKQTEETLKVELIKPRKASAASNRVKLQPMDLLPNHEGHRCFSTFGGCQCPYHKHQNHSSSKKSTASASASHSPRVD